MSQTKSKPEYITGKNGHWIYDPIDIHKLPIGEAVCDMHCWWVSQLLEHFADNGGSVKHTLISLDVARAIIENIGRHYVLLSKKIYHYDNKKLVVAGRDDHFTTLVYQIDETRAGIVNLA